MNCASVTVIVFQYKFNSVFGKTWGNKVFFQFEMQTWFQNRRMREKRLQKKMQTQGSRPDLLPVNSPSKDQTLYGSPGVDMSSMKDCVPKIEPRKVEQVLPGKCFPVKIVRNLDHAIAYL